MMMLMEKMSTSRRRKEQTPSSTTSGQMKHKAHVIESSEEEEEMEVMKDYALDHIHFCASLCNQICTYKEYQYNNVSFKDCILENKEFFNKMDPEINMEALITVKYLEKVESVIRQTNDEVNALLPVPVWSSIDVDDLETFPSYLPLVFFWKKRKMLIPDDIIQKQEDY